MLVIEVRRKVFQPLKEALLLKKGRERPEKGSFS